MPRTKHPLFNTSAGQPTSIILPTDLSSNTLDVYNKTSKFSINGPLKTKPDYQLQDLINGKRREQEEKSLLWAPLKKKSVSFLSINIKDNGSKSSTCKVLWEEKMPKDIKETPIKNEGDSSKGWFQELCNELSTSSFPKGLTPPEGLAEKLASSPPNGGSWLPKASSLKHPKK